MAFPDPKVICITGASSGLGRALALTYARPSIRVLLTGRNQQRLAAVAEDCRRAGAEIERLNIDIRDYDALRQWLVEMDRLHGVELLIVNAGTSNGIGDRAAGESWEDIERVIDVNLKAALATADAILPGMRQRGKGQIAFVSSVSAYFGLPLTPAYCASKSALKTYAESWRGWLTAEGIGITAVCPGFIETPMSAGFPGPRPFMMSAEKAAALIRHRLVRNPARISFPFPLNAGMWFLSIFPPAISVRLLHAFGFSVRPSRAPGN